MAHSPIVFVVGADERLWEEGLRDKFDGKLRTCDVGTVGSIKVAPQK